VKEVSDDTLHNTIEFNDFLQMMSIKENEEIGEDYLLEAFE
jgi:Ca2+-binding EF-hand superfamily protein